MSETRTTESVCHDLDQALFGERRNTGTEWLTADMRYRYLIRYVQDLKSSHDLLRKDRQLLERWLKEALEKQA